MTAHWKNLPDGADWISAMLAEVAEWERNFDAGVHGPMGAQGAKKVQRDRWVEDRARLIAAKSAQERAQPVEQKPLPLPKGWKDPPGIAPERRNYGAAAGRRYRKVGSDSQPSSRPLAAPPRPAAGHRECATLKLPGANGQQSERETILSQLELNRLRNRLRAQTGGE